MIEDCGLMIADCSKAVTSDKKKAGVGSQESEVRRTREQGTGSLSGFVIADSPRYLAGSWTIKDRSTANKNESSIALLFTYHLSLATELLALLFALVCN